MCGCLSHTPYWGPGLQPRPVLRLGIEPATLWFAGWRSIHWATPARAWGTFFVSLTFCVFSTGPSNQKQTLHLSSHLFETHTQHNTPHRESLHGGRGPASETRPLLPGTVGLPGGGPFLGIVPLPGVTRNSLTVLCAWTLRAASSNGSVLLSLKRHRKGPWSPAS